MPYSIIVTAFRPGTVLSNCNSTTRALRSGWRTVGGKSVPILGRTRRRRGDQEGGAVSIGPSALPYSGTSIVETEREGRKENEPPRLAPVDRERVSGLEATRRLHLVVHLGVLHRLVRKSSRGRTEKLVWGRLSWLAGRDRKRVLGGGGGCLLKKGATFLEEKGTTFLGGRRGEGTILDFGSLSLSLQSRRIAGGGLSRRRGRPVLREHHPDPRQTFGWLRQSIATRFWSPRQPRCFLPTHSFPFLLT